MKTRDYRENTFVFFLSTVNYCIAGIYKQPTAFESNTNEVKRISVIVTLADALAQTGACKPKEKNKAGKKRHKCDACNKAFPSPSQLIIHKRTHSSERPFECDTCQKCFRQSAHLKIHKRTHTGEMPFKCNVCKKCFSQSSNLYTHKRTHTGDMPFKYSQCRKAFGELTDHQQS